MKILCLLTSRTPLTVLRAPSVLIIALMMGTGLSAVSASPASANYRICKLFVAKAVHGQQGIAIDQVRARWYVTANGARRGGYRPVSRRVGGPSCSIKRDGYHCVMYQRMCARRG